MPSLSVTAMSRALEYRLEGSDGSEQLIMTPRRKTRQVRVGPVAIGGDAPVSIQSMTSTYTYDIDKTVAQIHELARAGADIVRVAVPEARDSEALRHILPQVPVPIVA